MFLQASVILLTGGGVPGPGGVSAPGGDCCGLCLLPWGGERLLPGVGCLAPGGAWSWGVPGGDTPRTATAAGGTHPTGMHSCLLQFYSPAPFPGRPPPRKTNA